MELLRKGLKMTILYLVGMFELYKYKEIKRKMKILYYSWNEYTSNDIMDVLARKGYEVDLIDVPIADKLRDVTLIEILKNKFKNNNYDCVFTFNFFPVISKVANEFGVKYISWSFDSPCFTLHTKDITNACNYVFCFDKIETMRLLGYGAKNVYHMPLGVNSDKLNNLLVAPVSETKYQYDVSFVGNLYNDEYNFFDQIKNMPEYYRGFFDGIINSQMNIFGYDLASDIITEEFAPVLNSFAKFNLDEEILLKNIDFFVEMIQKKITIVERPEILNIIANQGIDINHFAPKKDERLKNVRFRGYLNYDTEMPKVFRESKVNLNISLRTILSGIPLRYMDVMGAGGFLISNYQPELAEFFVDGEEVVMYSSRIDLIDKIQYYLENDEERITIAEKAKERIEKDFSYDVLLDKIFDVVGIG